MDLRRDKIHKYSISNESDVGMCRRKGVGFAKSIGFDDVKAGEIAIMITEMATNVLKHGGGKGHFMMCRVQNDHDLSGIEFWCCDFGQGIKNPEQAFEDGFTDKKSLGVGMGAIRRLSDELDINPIHNKEIVKEFNSENPTYSYCIRTRKWNPRQNWKIRNKKLESGAVTRPKPGESLNGDAYIFYNINSHQSIAAVIDGLGHGKEAHLASSLAREQIAKKPEFTVDVILKNIHDSIKGTRGVTIGLMKIDTDKNKLQFSGIGNIEGNILSRSGKKNLLSFGGIVGHNIRTPRVFEFDFNEKDIVYMFSDGITSRWNYEDVDWSGTAQQTAENIINKYARLNDDATILIIRYAS